jgi:beta-1,4-N-acetylglucosaminyltransferase
VIFVTVGTHTAPFDRLIRAADSYATGTLEEVIIQRGVSQLRTNAARSFDFCDSVQMQGIIRASRVVVCQGADTILDVLRAGRPILAVPRLKRYGEVINDHQVDFVRALARRKLILVLEDPESGIAEGIERAAMLPTPSIPDQPPLSFAMRDLLADWFQERPGRRLGESSDRSHESGEFRAGGSRMESLP